MTDDVKTDDDLTLDENVISIKAHTDKFLQLFSKKDDSSKTIGNEAIASQLSSMLDGQLLPQFFLQAIERFGAPKVDSVTRKICHQMKTSKISNLAAYFNKAILAEDLSEKTSLWTQNRPSSPIHSLNRNQNLSGTQNNDFSGGFSNLNAIDELKREHHWSLAENQAFYRRLSQDNRQPIVNEVAKKWFYLLEHAKIVDVDLLSDGFIHHNLFLPFAQVLNDIRLEQAAHSLRSRIWNES
jgi:hypothetical protein